MGAEEQGNVALVHAYLEALETGEAGHALGGFFTEDVRQIELPNRLNPTGQESDFDSMLKRSEIGKKIMREQQYEILSEVAEGSRVAVEARWVGVLAVPFGTLEAGAEMKATFCDVL